MSYDISIEFNNGEISDIEMQAWKEDYDYAVRAEIQAARLLKAMIALKTVDSLLDSRSYLLLPVP